MGNNTWRKGLANTSDLSHFAGKKERSNEIKKTKDTEVIQYQRHRMFNQVLGILNNLYRLIKEQLRAL